MKAPSKKLSAILKGGVFMGIFLLHLVPFHLQAQRITKPNEPGPIPGLNVNTYTGNLFYQRTDLRIPGRGLNIIISFAYNSGRNQRDWGFGNGWSFSYGMQYSRNADTIFIERADGQRDPFILSGTAWLPATGIYDRLSEYQAGKFLMVSPSGSKYYFDDDTHRKITSIEDRNGNEIKFTYIAGQLTTITDPSGQQISLSWNNGHLEQVTDLNYTPNRKIAFDYDESWNLSGFTDPAGKSVEYAYGDWNNLTGITDARGLNILVAYNDHKAVKEISCPTSNIQIKFDWNDPGTNVTKVSQTVSGEIRQTYYYFDAAGRVTQIRFPGGGTVFYEWDVHNNLLRFADENGHSTAYSWDQGGNRLSLTDANGIMESWTYETAFNQVTGWTDKNGRSTSYQYDSYGNLIKKENSLLQTQTYSYDTYGNLASMTDLNGGVTQYTYDVLGHLVGITDPVGHAETFAYDNGGNRSGHTDKNGHLVESFFDILNRPVSRTDAAGNTAYYQYDANGNLTTKLDVNGNRTTKVYDLLGRLTQHIDPLLQSTTFEYDQAGNLVKETAPNGSETIYQYDGRDRLVKLTDCLGNQELFAYDPAGNLVQQTDKNANLTQYEYDALNRLIKVTDHQGYISNYSYDPVGNLISETDANGNATTYSYDPLHRVVVKTDALGSEVSFVYDAAGNRISETDARGYFTNYSFDSLNRVIKKTDPLGHTVNYSYDPVGNRISETDANGNTTAYSYDPPGRLTSKTDPLGNVTRYTYDPAGNRVSETDAGGSTTAYSYDPLNRLARITDAGGMVTVYSYDPVGNRISETDANGNTTTFNYDCIGNLIQVVTPLGNQTSYTYDGNGNTTRRTDPKGTIIQYLYDHQDRLVTVNYPAGAIQKAYDPAGNLVHSASLGIGLGDVTDRTYDALNRVTSETIHYGPFSKTVSYLYDPAGNFSGLTYPDGMKLIYEYDNASRLIKVTDPWAGETLMEYDPAGNLSKTILPNGEWTQTDYDASNRMISKTTKDSLNQGIFRYDYTYDAVGHILSEYLNGIPSSLFSYNALGQLINAQYPFKFININYTYDPAGNRLSHNDNGNVTSLVYNAEDRVVTQTFPDMSTIQYTYDNNGNVVQTNSNWGVVNYFYNLGNRLTGIDYPAPYGQIRNFYSSEGIRLARNERGTITYFLPTLLGTAMEMDNLGNPLVRINPDLSIAREPGSFKSGDAMVTTDPEIVYSHWNGTGSTTFFTGNSIVVSASFDYFGGILETSGDVDGVDPGLYASTNKIDWDPMLGAELIGGDYAPDIDQHYGNVYYIDEHFGPGSDPFEDHVAAFFEDHFNLPRHLGWDWRSGPADVIDDRPGEVKAFELCPAETTSDPVPTGKTKWSEPTAKVIAEKQYYCTKHKRTSTWKLISETITLMREVKAYHYKCTLRKDHTGPHNWAKQRADKTWWEPTAKKKSRKYWVCGC